MSSRLLYLPFLLWSVCVFTKAQTFSDMHSPQIGDKFDKEEVTFKSFPNEETSNKIWDISDIESLGKNVSIEYLANPKAENSIIGIEHNTRYCYIQQGDKLLLKSYENNQSKVVYDTPILAYTSFTDYGFHNNSSFDALCTYSEKVHSKIYGQYTYEVDGIGSMVLPSGDSLRHVSRVHVLKHSTQRYHEVNNDSNTVETNSYRWYALGYRYPIYETTESHVKGNPNGFRVAYYLSPQLQELLDDKENERTRNTLSRKMYSHEDAYSSSNKTKLADSTILSYCLKSQADGKVSLSLSCSKKKNVSLGLYTLDGLVIRKDNLSNVSEQVWTQDLHTALPKVFLLSITIDGETFTEKFVNK